MSKLDFRKRACLGDYLVKKRPSQKKPRRANGGINHTFRLYEKKKTVLSRIPDDEREFFREWTESRNLENQYHVLALTYWMRVRAEIAVLFLLRDKRMYMIVCIHIALKWLGYDEVYKCDFIRDLRELNPVDPQEHGELEMEVLRALSWEL